MSGLQGVQTLFAGEPELVPGALRGYRTWGGVTDDGRLVSTGVDHFWRPSPLAGSPEVAQCLRAPTDPGHDEPAPGRSCPCGLYGWYVPDDVRMAYGQIVGVVQASGRLILGLHGFRASRLVVLGVTVAGWSPVRELLLTRLRAFGYPVFDDVESMVDALPPDDMGGLVEHDCAQERCEQRAARSVMVPGLRLPTPSPPPRQNHIHVALGASTVAAQSTFQAVIDRLSALAGTTSDQAVKLLSALTDDEPDGQSDDDPPPDPRARALQAHRNRGTGPSPGPMFRAAVRAARRGRA
jgi:hypothetical protein